jgi:hypothetical protein
MLAKRNYQKNGGRYIKNFFNIRFFVAIYFSPLIIFLGYGIFNIILNIAIAYFSRKCCTFMCLGIQLN